MAWYSAADWCAMAREPSDGFKAGGGGTGLGGGGVTQCRRETQRALAGL